MSDTRSGSGPCLPIIILAVALIASVVVACATSLTSTPASPTVDTEAPLAPTEPAVSPTAPVTATPTTAPPINTPASSPTPTTEAEDSLAASTQHGQALYASLGCAGCHGAQGEGNIGPTIAQTELALSRVIRQYRAPYQSMPRFGPDQVSETDIADIYAFLQTLPTPETQVPSVLAQVMPEAGIGTIRGTIRYADSSEPAADEQIFLVPAELDEDGSLVFNYVPHLPAGTTNAQGEFNIADVEAELYAVFYSRAEEPVRDEGGNVVLVNVLPGEVTEVQGVILQP